MSEEELWEYRRVKHLENRRIIAGHDEAQAINNARRKEREKCQAEYEQRCAELEQEYAELEELRAENERLTAEIEQVRQQIAAQQANQET